MTFKLSYTALFTYLDLCELFVPLNQATMIIGPISIGGETSHHLNAGLGNRCRCIHTLCGIQRILQVLDVQVDSEARFKVPC